MPLKDGTPYCVNHPDTQLSTDKDQINTVTSVVLTPHGVRFEPDKGILVKAYACPKCGYMELYWQHELAEKYREKEKTKLTEVAKAAAVTGKH
jgi:aromatic ring-opening dioxygenase LigB subunit